MGAHLGKKGEATFENKSYDPIDAIVLQFMKDVYQIVKDFDADLHLKLSDAWKAILAGAKEEQAAKTEGDVAASSQLLSHEQLKSKAEVATALGFIPGRLVYEKAVSTKAGASAHRHTHVVLELL